MSDSKISALSPASTVYTGDYMLLTQLGNSVKLALSTLFTQVPIRISVIEASESPTSGAVATNLLVSKLTAAITPVAYTLAAGTHGMEKQLVVNLCPASSSAIVTVSGASGFSTLTFNAITDVAWLKNIDGLWYVMSNNSITVA